MTNCEARMYTDFGDEEKEFKCSLEEGHHGPHTNFIVGHMNKALENKAALIWNYNEAEQCHGCDEHFNATALEDGRCESCDSFFCEICEDIYPRGYRFSERSICVNCRF